MGTCTVTVSKYTVMGNQQVRFGTIHASSSYASGGDTFTAAQFGLNSITSLEIEGGVSATPTAAFYVADLTNKKLLAFAQNGSTGLLNESSGDLSAVPANYIAYGY